MSTVADLGDLEGRAALVTGAAGNLGVAITETLSELGATVIAIDKDADALGELSGKISNIHPVAWDLERSDTFPELRELVIGEWGELSILINNAAFLGHSGLEGWACSFEKQAPEAWDACLNLNLSAPFRLVQTFAADLSASKHGSVINIASIHASLGPDWSLYEGTEMAHPAAYAASKGGLVQITRWLATTLAPDVRVNSISPGGVERGQPEAFVERYNGRTPLRRMAVPSDIKGAIAFLASDLSAYVTGHDLVVDGGYSIW